VKKPKKKTVKKQAQPSSFNSAERDLTMEAAIRAAESLLDYHERQKLINILQPPLPAEVRRREKEWRAQHGTQS
jgi:hypothetical protein